MKPVRSLAALRCRAWPQSLQWALALLALWLCALALAPAAVAATSAFASAPSSARYHPADHIVPVSDVRLTLEPGVRFPSPYVQAAPPSSSSSTPSRFGAKSMNTPFSAPASSTPSRHAPFGRALRLSFSASGEDFDLDLALNTDVWHPDLRVNTQDPALSSTSSSFSAAAAAIAAAATPLQSTFGGSFTDPATGEETRASVTLFPDGSLEGVLLRPGETLQLQPLRAFAADLTAPRARRLAALSARAAALGARAASDLVLLRLAEEDVEGGEDGEGDGVLSSYAECHAVDLDAAADSGGAHGSHPAAHSAATSSPAGSAASRKLLLKRWTGCTGTGSPVYRLPIGIAVDQLFVAAHEGSIPAVMARIALVVAQANLVYQTQVGVVLSVKAVEIRTAPTTEKWNQRTMPCADIGTTLTYLQDWRRMTNRVDCGLWHLLTACYPAPGVVGMANIARLCRKFEGVGITSISHVFWLTFAHEIGHNFAAPHTFAEGVGSTGGLMDYGDGKLKPTDPDNPFEFGFNTKYSQAPICQHIQATLAAPSTSTAFVPKENCLTPYAPTCGNGVVEAGEDCDSGAAAGDACCDGQCRLREGAECGELAGECCTRCKQAPVTTLCNRETGYCGAGGVCVRSQCDRHGFVFCGMGSKNATACTEYCVTTTAPPEVPCLPLPDMIAQYGSPVVSAPAWVPTATTGLLCGATTDASTGAGHAQCLFASPPDLTSASTTASADPCTGAAGRSPRCVPSPDFQWKASAASACVAPGGLSCGPTGVNVRQVSCVDSVSGLAADARFCTHLPSPVFTTTCTPDTPSCPGYRWATGPWSLCPCAGEATAPGFNTDPDDDDDDDDDDHDKDHSHEAHSVGSIAAIAASASTSAFAPAATSTPTRTRQVLCVDSKGHTVKDNPHACDPLPRPSSSEPCTPDPRGCAALPTYTWSCFPSGADFTPTGSCDDTASWSICAGCQRLVQERTVVCVQDAASATPVQVDAAFCVSASSTSPSSTTAPAVPASVQVCANIPTSCLRYEWRVVGDPAACMSSTLSRIAATAPSRCTVNGSSSPPVAGNRTGVIACFAVSNTDGSATKLPDSDCEQIPKPAAASFCATGPCLGVTWVYTAWTPAMCDPDDTAHPVQTRTALCLDSLLERADGACDLSTRVDSRPCPVSPLTAAATAVAPAAPAAVAADVADAGSGMHTQAAKDLPDATEVTGVTSAWQPSAWGPCSASCDGGITTRTVRCVDTATGDALDDSVCNLNPGVRPALTAPCNPDPCPPVWAVATSTACPDQCAAAASSASSTLPTPPVQTRTFTCQTASGNPLNATACRGLPLPAVTLPCPAAALPCPRWQTGPFGPCQPAVPGAWDAGVRTRTVVCVDAAGRVLDAPATPTNTGSATDPAASPVPYCTAATRPADSESCTAPALSFRIGDWGDCEDSCGASAVQRRSLTCVTPAFEDAVTPLLSCATLLARQGVPPVPLTRACGPAACPRLHYRVGDWQACPLSCTQAHVVGVAGVAWAQTSQPIPTAADTAMATNTGTVQQRRVTCWDDVLGTAVAESLCIATGAPKPLHTRPCGQQPCPTSYARLQLSARVTESAGLASDASSASGAAAAAVDRSVCNNLVVAARQVCAAVTASAVPGSPAAYSVVADSLCSSATSSIVLESDLLRSQVVASASAALLPPVQADAFVCLSGSSTGMNIFSSSSSATPISGYCGIDHRCVCTHGFFGTGCAQRATFVTASVPATSNVQLTPLGSVTAGEPLDIAWTLSHPGHRVHLLLTHPDFVFPLHIATTDGALPLFRWTVDPSLAPPSRGYRIRVVLAADLAVDSDAFAVLSACARTSCSTHGTCSPTSGTCVCISGWTGAACDVAVTTTADTAAATAATASTASSDWDAEGSDATGAACPAGSHGPLCACTYIEATLPLTGLPSWWALQDSTLMSSLLRLLGGEMAVALGAPAGDVTFSLPEDSEARSSSRFSSTPSTLATSASTTASSAASIVFRVHREPCLSLSSFPDASASPAAPQQTGAYWDVATPAAFFTSSSSTAVSPRMQQLVLLFQPSSPIFSGSAGRYIDPNQPILLSDATCAAAAAAAGTDVDAAGCSATVDASTATVPVPSEDSRRWVIIVVILLLVLLGILLIALVIHCAIHYAKAKELRTGGKFVPVDTTLQPTGSDLPDSSSVGIELSSPSSSSSSSSSSPSSVEAGGISFSSVPQQEGEEEHALPGRGGDALLSRGLARSVASDDETADLSPVAGQDSAGVLEQDGASGPGPVEGHSKLP